MGQVSSFSQNDIILSPVDRLVARNSDGGLNPLASHVILFGESAGRNDSLSNVLGIGAFSLGALGTGLAGLNLDGTIALGVRAAATLQTGTNNDDATPASVIIGNNAARDTQFLSGAVIIGAEALKTYVGSAAGAGAERCVIIGNEACQNQPGAVQFSSNTVIGWRAMRAGAPVGSVSNVFVGDQIASVAASALTQNTVIGSNAGHNMGGSSQCNENVIIGEGAAATLDGGDQNVIIGRAADVAANGAANQSFNTIVGYNANAYGSQHTILGYKANLPSFGVIGARSILIGYQAGITLAANLTDICAIETFDAPTQRGCLYADMAAGNVILGKSTQGVDRDMGAAGSGQLVKLLNGTFGANPPVGGGFLLSQGGELFFQSSGAGVSAGTSKYQLTGQYTVANLPAGTLGSRCFVTNALAPAFGAIVAGGGAVFTPVYFDGAAWRVG